MPQARERRRPGRRCRSRSSTEPRTCPGTRPWFVSQCHVHSLRPVPVARPSNRSIPQPWRGETRLVAGPLENRGKDAASCSRMLASLRIRSSFLFLSVACDTAKHRNQDAHAPGARDASGPTAAPAPGATDGKPACAPARTIGTFQSSASISARRSARTVASRPRRIICRRATRSTPCCARRASPRR
jgi:hypothetical protein